MKPTLPLVALGILQISCIYCSAVHRAGQDRHTGRRQALHRGTRWNEDKHGHERRSYSSSNHLVFKSQGSYGRPALMPNMSSSCLKANNILLSFSLDSSQPYQPQVASSRISGRRGSKTSGIPNKVKKLQQSRGHKQGWNNIKAPRKARKKNSHLHKSKSQNLRGKRVHKRRT